MDTEEYNNKALERMIKRDELRREQEEELTLRKLSYEVKTARVVYLSNVFHLRKAMGLKTSDITKQIDKETDGAHNA